MKDKIAIISIGGKQHLVTVGSVLAVNRLEMDASKKIMTEALLVSNDNRTMVGEPTVDKAKVELKILEHTKGKKVKVSRFRAKSRYRRMLGHRQPLTTLEVVSIKS